ncbi:hypothetical protein L1049_023509 [Liquidambar formosana]|uniref:3-oxo-5-alpha-steroid 4-dehydrogenase C-terminal domain-containing protein n=1 Tax=Liquidambar formosana TaxID=63359 RepID=A0AAP0RU58_LIQFO
MEIHVVRRLYETVYVFKYRHSARMHIFGYLTGLFFYMAAPLSLCTFCAVEALKFAVDQLADFNVKGQDMMSIIDSDWWGAHYDKIDNKLMSMSYPMVIGLKLFQVAHHLAEMIIYAGLLLASGGTDLTIWLLFGFVVANLSLAAAETQRWYLHKFEDYLCNQWAILPFVYQWCALCRILNNFGGKSFTCSSRNTEVVSPQV